MVQHHVGTTFLRLILRNFTVDRHANCDRGSYKETYKSQRRRSNEHDDAALFCRLGRRTCYEVIFEWSNYYTFQPFWKVFAVWEGGLAIHGAILGGIIAYPLYCRVKKLSLRRNFMNQLVCK